MESENIMSDVVATNVVPVDEINLREMFSAIWRGKWLVVIITTFFTILAIVYALSQPNIYRSEIVLVPAMTEDGSTLASIAGKFGGFANLAGIGLNATEVDKTSYAIEVLKSRTFLTSFINRHDLAVPLLAAKGWDLESGRWILDREIFNEQSGEWVRNVTPPKVAAPTAWELFNVFSKKSLEVNKDNKTMFVRVGVNSLSPVAAQQWATWLVEDLNQHVRMLDIAEAERSIDYLKKQIDQTSNTSMHKIFYQLIEQQTKVAMLAQIRSEYVFKVVDPAVIPEVKVGPMRAQISILGALVGLMVSLAVVLILHYQKNNS